MKKELLSLMIALPACAFAQNIGIGTTAPTGRLDVFGTTAAAASNVLMVRNAASDTLFKIRSDGSTFLGTPSVADILKYRLRVETGTTNGSLFIENPIHSANTTVKILRGVTEAASSGETTALDVEASGDYAAVFSGYGGISATSNTLNFPAAAFIATPGGYAITSAGRLQLYNINEGTGRVLTSDSVGNAVWQNPVLVAHTHFGETWGGNASNGLVISNNNSTSSGSAIAGVMNNGGNQQNYGVRGITNSTNGIGIVGINTSSGSESIPFPNSGVSGVAGTGAGVYGSSLYGPSIYGFKTFLSATGNAGKFENDVPNNTDAVVLITNSATNPMALELNNGFIKVSGTNKTAFQAVSAAGNISGNLITLNYLNMSQTDIVIAVHNFSSNYIGATGVWWNGLGWTVYREDKAPMPVGETFNIMVIKQ